MTNLSMLSDSHLADSVGALLQDSENREAADRFQAVLHSLQVQSAELEMQNRALKESQVELEQSREHYADLYDHLPVGYLTLSPRGEILEANLTVAEWLKRERSHLVGEYLRSFIAADDASRLAMHLFRCAHTNGAEELDLDIQIGDEQAFPAQLSSYSRVVSPGEREIRTAITKVTLLKEIQRGLQQVNEEQEAFNYSVSHDFRAPLLTMGNFARILREDYSDDLSAEGKAMVNRIENASLRMQDMLRRLLDLSRISRARFEPEIVELEPAIDAVLLEHRSAVESTKAEVVVTRPLPCVFGSSVMINQVLSNLIENALKFTAPATPPRVEISAATDPRTVVVSVRDHGIGVPAEHTHRIFNAFERLHSVGKYAGCGLGLSIARRAVERMNGRIWLESQVGSGTTFFVELPRG